MCSSHNLHRNSHADSLFLTRTRKSQANRLKSIWNMGQNSYSPCLLCREHYYVHPFGILAPMVFKRMRKMSFCVFIGFLCSCGIEISQLITQRGYCQLDDVVTNTVGMLIGWIIWRGFHRVVIETLRNIRKGRSNYK